jgi:formylglycine-generating enzyme required for sulfatase activity
MVLIPAGTFTMGSDRGLGREQPVHPVYLDAYYIDRYEVTLGQYRACVEAGACAESAEAGRCVWYGGTDEAEPINCMTWYDAQAYCRWASLRLPSEAEWEKAARGADGRNYPWGEQVDRNRANYKGGYGRAVAVGSYPEGASPYGVYDMGGNVWEWVGDWYDANYYFASEQRNPAGPSRGTHRVLRGGSWCFLSEAMRSTHRQPYDPEITDTDIGFRCARDAE